MARNTTVRKPASGGTTRRPAVDHREPEKSATTNETENGTTDTDTEGDETTASKVAEGTDPAKVPDGPGVNRATRGGDDDEDEDDTRGEEAKKLSAENSGPNVSAGGGDGATYAPAVGTSREMAAKLSTKEGDAPIGMERDVGAGGENTTGPSSQAEASLSSRAPAGTVLARQQTNEVGERVFEVLRDFSNSGDDTQISLTSNLHDDLGIQRAHIVYVAAKLEEEFGIDITPSEAQNILLARDAVNTVLRKLAAQG